MPDDRPLTAEDIEQLELAIRLYRMGRKVDLERHPDDGRWECVEILSRKDLHPDTIAALEDTDLIGPFKTMDELLEHLKKEGL